MAAKKRRSKKGTKKIPKSRSTRALGSQRKKTGSARKKKKPAPRKEAVKKEPHGRRADYAGSVEKFVASLPKEKQDIVNALREIIHEAVPGVVETIRWGMPVFTRKKLICYASTKSPYVRFGFYARIELDDPDKRLAGSLAYVKLNDVSEIERPLLHSWIQQIVLHTDA